MKIFILIFCLITSLISADTTQTITLAQEFDQRIKVSVGIVELNETLGDFSRMSITKTGSDDNGLQNLDVKFPVLITPAGELTVVTGSIVSGENVWNFILESIVKEGRGRLINETFLVINNNEVGTIDASSKEPYQSMKIIGDIQQLVVEFLDIGTKASIHPSLLNIQRVNIDLDFEISEVLTTRNSQELIPVRSVRQITTNIDLAPNEYVIIGGLDQEKTIEFINGIPFLRNIPWIGTMFTSREQKTSRTKLYIMINASALESEDRDKFMELKKINEEELKPQGIMGKMR